MQIDEVKYIGHIFTKKGIKIDNKKIQAIVEMKKPSNVKSLESFLGMITYVSRYIPNVSHLTAPLRQLIKKDVAWCWNEEHKRAFKQLKEILIKEPILKYFDPTKPINSISRCI